VWNGRARNIGVVVLGDRGFAAVRALGRGELMRRLSDVPREEIERLEETLRGLDPRLAGGAALVRLEGVARGHGTLRVGKEHASTTQRLSWAVRERFEECAHPDIGALG